MSEYASDRPPFFVIAVDGPAASGKGTIAAALAKAYDLPMLDTGLLYRCVGVLMHKAHENLDDEGAACAAAALLTADQLDDPALRTRAAGELASRVAVHPRVRDALMDFQRTFARARRAGRCWTGATSARSSRPTPRPSSMSPPSRRCARAGAGPSSSPRASASA